MNRHLFSLFIATLLSFGFTTIFAQTKPSNEQVQLAPPALTGSLENVSGEYHLRLANNDPTRSFQGTALVGFGNAAEQATMKVPFTIGPHESSIFLLYSLPATAAPYSLIVTDIEGRVVLHRIAPVRKITDISLADALPTTRAVRTAPETGGDVQVKVALTSGESENDPFVLAFEIMAPRPLPNTSLAVTAKGFQQSARANLGGRTSVEFKLPDELEAQKIGYTLTDAFGRVLAKGEADLNQLLSDERAALGGVTPDRESYKPGDVAHIKVAMRNSARNAYQLEIVGKDSRGTIFFRDLRRGGTREKRSPAQEFNLTLPRDVAGPVKVEVKLTDAESGSLLDSSEKELAVADGNNNSD